ncbi:ROK family protein [Streptomyces sp. NBC_01238]|uniref:ROK family transcriptional regulator n=1 Tax=Streptomyces sp. NBC_01238 TaxID=2903791 RepID=UPI00386859B1
MPTTSGEGGTTTVACAAALHSLGEATLTELSRATGLSRPTVRERLNELGSLVEITSGADHRESPTPSGGRPASRFRFRGEYGFVVGAEITRHDERIVVCDIGGRICHYSEHHDAETLPGRERIAAFKKRLNHIVSRLSTGHERWLGVGLALTGGIGADGWISHSPVFPDLWGCAPADAGLSFGDVPLRVEHDLNAAAMAEYVYGAARGAGTFAHVLAWHQIAAGIVLNGRVHRGSHNLAGELGHFDDGSRAPASWEDVATFLPVVEAAARGDVVSAADLDAFADATARQIAYLALAIDPDLVVLGGPLVHSSAFTDRVGRTVQTLLRRAYPLDLTITRFPRLGPSLGALQLALNGAFGDLLGDVSFPARIDVRPLSRLATADHHHRRGSAITV